MGKKTMNGEARGRDIHDGKERTLAKLQPTQLALFQMFVPEDDNRLLTASEKMDIRPCL